MNLVQFVLCSIHYVHIITILSGLCIAQTLIHTNYTFTCVQSQLYLSQWRMMFIIYMAYFNIVMWVLFYCVLVIAKIIK